MIDFFKELDINILKFINTHHTPWLDHVMIFISAKWVWLPLYALLIFLIYRHDGRMIWKTLIVIFFVILLADQTASAVFKPWMARARPCYVAEFEPWLHVPAGCGGRYGFMSSHAANTAAATTLLYFYMRRRYPLLVWLYVWVAATLYSRVYLGVHYPSDVLAGAAVGTLYGYLGMYILQKLNSHAQSSTL